MSYDYPDGYVPPPPEPMTIRRWFLHRWIDFVLWLALDCKAGLLNDLGIWLLYRTGKR